MAEEHIEVRTNQFKSVPPLDAPAESQTREPGPEQPQFPERRPSEIVMWFVVIPGLVIIFAGSLGIIGLSFYFRSEVGLLAPLRVSFWLFVWLEKDMWLNRFLGLHVTPSPSRILWALLYSCCG